MAHDELDEDSSVFATHHTLGLRPQQASPGSHNHDGENSNLLDGVVGATVAVKDEGLLIYNLVNTLNFKGAEVVATDAGGGQVDIAVTSTPSPPNVLAVADQGFVVDSNVVSLDFLGTKLQVNPVSPGYVSVTSVPNVTIVPVGWTPDDITTYQETGSTVVTQDDGPPDHGILWLCVNSGIPGEWYYLEQFKRFGTAPTGYEADYSADYNA
jgi:hypothetical protein